MTLGEYYSTKSRNLSPERRRQELKNKAFLQLQNSASVEQCKKLQDFLNQAFYPEKYRKGSGTQYATRINKAVEAAYMAKHNQILNNFSIGTSTATYGKISTEDLPQLIRERHDAIQHKNKIYYTTIESRLNKVKQLLGTAVDDLNEFTMAEGKIEVSLQNLYISLKKLLEIKADGKDNIGDFINLKNNQNVFEQVAQMDEMYAALSQVGGVFTPQDYGDVLEWILEAFSNNGQAIIDEISEDLTDEALKKIGASMIDTAGSIKTGASQLNLLSLSKNINIVDDKNVSITKKKSKNNKKEETYFNIRDENGNSFFEFKAVNGFNPDSSRQGKMDVNFVFNDSNSKQVPFRISAKNWLNTDRDFGKTELIYALLRSAGNVATIEYIYAMQDEKNESIRKGYHELAKYSALLDILMGYSQKNNYADTLVLNIRSEQKVIVASIADILSKIENNISNNLRIEGYDDSLIHTRMTILRNVATRQAGSRSRNFKNLSFKYLQSIEVMLKYSNISAFISTNLTQ